MVPGAGGVGGWEGGWEWMGGCHQPRSLAQKNLIFGKNFAEKRLNPE